MARTSLLSRVPATILPSAKGRQVIITTDRPTAEAVPDHDPTPDGADVRAGVARGRILVRIQLPDDTIKA